MYHNIEKSAFRPGQWVGYGCGTVWHIRKVKPRGRAYYVATNRDTYESHTAYTLRELSEIIDRKPGAARAAEARFVAGA